MSEVYLDHAATTDVRGEVIEAMAAAMRDVGNPSSLHAAGRRARNAVETAREQVAAAVGADPVEVIFTSGATEADNLAVTGGYLARRDKDPTLTALAVSAGEHPAVLDTARRLADGGADLRLIELDARGAPKPQSLTAELADRRVAIAAAIWANNEIGAITDVAALSRICAEQEVPLHVDAVQALGRVPIDFHAMRLSGLALSAHKVGGPQGVGALIVARAFTPTPITHGGGQERRIRSGTLATPVIVGMGVAVSMAEAEREEEARRLGALRDRLTDGLRGLDEVAVNGPASYRPQHAHPGIVSIHAPGADADALLMLLDADGIDVSTGSACTSGVTDPSHVILAMTGDEKRAKQTIRVSLGRTSTAGDVDRLLAALPRALRLARAAGATRR